jgi:hypothetical protein
MNANMGAGAARLLLVSSVLAAVAGCASDPLPSPAPVPPPMPAPVPAPASPPAPAVADPAVSRYRCDQDTAFTVRFQDGSAVIDAGARGSETVLRDAGGLTPEQTVYSSTALRAEFGLGPNGREAVLHYRSPALEAHCVRED